MPGATDLLLAFGVSRNVTIVDARSNNQFDGKVPNTVVRDPALYTSSLGTPVLADITFRGGSYTDANGQTVTFPEVRMETVLITASQAKIIETTKIQGHNGTVKEYIGMDDYNITVDGILTGGNGVYPLQKVLDLKKVLDAPITVDVVCAYLNRLDIFSVVIMDYEFPQLAGGYSQQTFSIKCLSDLPVELIIT